MKGVIFDLDGTLLDTLTDLTRIVNVTLKELGYPERSAEEVKWFVGHGARYLIGHALPEGVELTDEIFARMLSNYAKYQNELTTYYEGVRELLLALKERGIRAAIVTNKPDAAAQEVQKIYFDGLLDYTVGVRPGEAVKPDPHTCFEALKKLGITAEEAVYVGDSDTDLETARNAGLRFVGAAWGFRGEAFLKEHGADVVIGSPLELLNYL